KQDGTESEGEWGETEIDVSGVVKELTYRTFYYGDTEINCTLETTYNEVYDNITGKLFYEISGYKLTVTTTKETVKLSVTQMKSGYAVYANDTLVGVVPFEMDIEPTPAP
ncbi:MAG: hypothetical protein MJ239_03580, partial [Bacilli bacterium]|nr:hypothetical protein [Bacilli bacterium]